MKPILILKSSTDEKQIELDSDDQFLHSIERFVNRIQAIKKIDADALNIKHHSKLITTMLYGGNEK